MGNFFCAELKLPTVSAENLHNFSAVNQNKYMVLEISYQVVIIHNDIVLKVPRENAFKSRLFIRTGTS